jgi:hypothetical protein
VARVTVIAGPTRSPAISKRKPPKGVAAFRKHMPFASKISTQSRRRSCHTNFDSVRRRAETVVLPRYER